MSRSAVVTVIFPVYLADSGLIRWGNEKALENALSRRILARTRVVR